MAIGRGRSHFKTVTSHGECSGKTLTSLPTPSPSGAVLLFVKQTGSHRASETMMRSKEDSPSGKKEQGIWRIINAE